LVNALSAAGYERAAVLAALESVGAPPGARAETLSPPDYAVMAEALA
jgi:hypothetical protein